MRAMVSACRPAGRVSRARPAASVVTTRPPTRIRASATGPIASSTERSTVPVAGACAESAETRKAVWHATTNARRRTLLGSFRPEAR